MRIAMIPARSGSKGVPGKNLRHIGGRSLLARAIECARETGLFERIFVSTDSPDYAREAASLGIETPWLRPAELAGDKALIADAIRHTLEKFARRGEIFETLCLLEPSSPLRTADIVRQTVAAAEAKGWDAAFTVSKTPLQYHALKQFKLDADGGASFVMERASPNVNRQSLAPTFIRNGLAYAVASAAFLASNSIHGTRARAILVDAAAISIDNTDDLEEAEQLIASREKP